MIALENGKIINGSPDEEKLNDEGIVKALNDKTTYSINVLTTSFHKCFN